MRQHPCNHKHPFVKYFFYKFNKIILHFVLMFDLMQHYYVAKYLKNHQFQFMEPQLNGDILSL